MRPAEMDDDRLKRVFRRHMQDIADGNHTTETITTCARCEEVLRERGFDPEVVAEREIHPPVNQAHELPE